MTPQIAEQKPSQWLYTTITLHDGPRVLHPTHVSFDRVVFSSPPRLTATQVEIVIANGLDEFRSTALILPHAPDATEIPIRSAK